MLREVTISEPPIGRTARRRRTQHWLQSELSSYVTPPLPLHDRPGSWHHAYDTPETGQALHALLVFTKPRGRWLRQAGCLTHRE